MAQQKTVRWHELDVRLGDGASSEAFVAPCALRARSIAFETQTSEAAPLDCESPETPAWMVRTAISKGGTISGNGLLDPDDLGTWWDYYSGGVEKNVRMAVNKPLADGGGYFQGPYILTRFELNGERDGEGGMVAISVEMQSAGVVSWTDASA